MTDTQSAVDVAERLEAFVRSEGQVGDDEVLDHGTELFSAGYLDSIGIARLIGFIEGMWSAYFSIDYKDVAAFSILAIVLIFLPSGILGRPEVEKV